ncbi:HD domain-containing protein [Priestia taiwanensis]|uniref:HD domain-containing protein n=1 Tax=Priestia taiwanensis TaxID=1347902 RepID=A0A917AN92_9BACI|nr:HD domain-containing protein [Priestia taiwanensis]MBM7362507.1 HD superfamily phosphohydrolase [Priestia taiwanensis]GGE62785.1 hypothetical protein GCM10007140_11310 [Priestia taiwanensis]
MKIYDPLYGKFDVENVLGEVIQSPPIQRLKNIHQGGACYLVNPLWDVTRYEHSIGVMLLIRKLGGSIEEQIAGLLHDVSHTAFSHVIDYVLKHEQEDYHESIYEQVIEQSSIPKILEKYGYNYKHLLYEQEWGLLEQPLPLLCADRIDYTLRDLARSEEIKVQRATSFLDSLVVVEGQIAVTSIEQSEWFVQTYYREVIDYFLHPLNIYVNEVMTKVIQRAMEHNILVVDDFLLEDEQVLHMLRSSENKEVLTLLQMIHQEVEENEHKYDLHVAKKIRLIDPLVYHNETLAPVSHLSIKVQSWNEEALIKSEKGTFVKVRTKN